TTGFTMPEQFFSSLQNYVEINYYSYNTVFAPGLPGPAARVSDARYIYGDCLTASVPAGTCVTVQGFSVRKVAHKGLLYWSSCAVTMLRNGGDETACDKTLASIDVPIAQQQFDELGPVIAQHVAAFIQFYAPALTVQVQ